MRLTRYLINFCSNYSQINPMKSQSSYSVIKQLTKWPQLMSHLHLSYLHIIIICNHIIFDMSVLLNVSEVSRPATEFGKSLPTNFTVGEVCTNLWKVSWIAAWIYRFQVLACFSIHDTESTKRIMFIIICFASQFYHLYSCRSVCI